MTERIMVGVALRDDDPAPVALGVQLARFLRAPLALVNVFHYDEISRVPAPALEAELRAASLEGLHRVAAAIPDDVEATAHPVAGSSTVRALHDAAIALDAALLIVGSSHRGPLLRVMPGGVGERLLHAAPCALAIAPRGFAGDGDGVRRIGVAFVDTPEGRDALSAGATLAALGEADLVVHTVLEPPRVGPGGATPGWVPAAPYDAEPRMRAAEEQVRAQLPDGLDARVVVQEGEPAELLAAASPELDLLICGSRGYGPLRTVLQGGVSGRLAHTAACPLVVLPRASDRSPATPRHHATR
jgi:nucleotide-binding universal stress UspA family protein